METTTLYEIAKTIKKVDLDNPRAGGIGPHSPSIVRGMRPEHHGWKEGLHTLTPWQLLALEVPVLRRGDEGFEGFQRPVIERHARTMARAMRDGEPFPPIQVSAVGGGHYWLTDGQHTALAAVMLGMDANVTIHKRDPDEARRLFANQGKARRVNPNVLVLAATDPFSEYVQDAITCPQGNDNPWAGQIGERATHSKISPGQARRFIVSYVLNRRTSGGERPAEGAFHRGDADEAGLILKCFGGKAANPLAYQPVSLNAIVSAAVIICKRGPGSADRKAVLERWQRHMPSFDFSRYQHMRRSSELTDMLVAHWNKRLSGAMRVTR